jgi:uncharacterized protein
MLILLSPAKTLDESIPSYKQYTLPALLPEAMDLARKYKAFSVADISKKMKVSREIATLTVIRFREFSLPHNLKNSKQAIFTFKGTVYRDIDATKYEEKQMAFLQKHVRILSGMYGILRPLDLMQPYRLEMALVRPYWKDKVTKVILQETDDVILNLASAEYFTVIGEVGKRVISPQFKEPKNGEYKIITIYTKFARGTMTNWIIRNCITKVDDLKKFNEDGYRYNEELSTKDVPVFVRK